MKEEALRYHRQGRPGKIELKVTKPCTTQRELSLAYTPGVAEPCREIVKDEASVLSYTARGNLVALGPGRTHPHGTERSQVLPHPGPAHYHPGRHGPGSLFIIRFMDTARFAPTGACSSDRHHLCSLYHPPFAVVLLGKVQSA